MYFDIYYNNTLCGGINTRYDGLYVVFEIDAEIVNLNISRVYLRSDEKNILLGVLMPKNNRYVLIKKIPTSFVKKNNINESFVAYIECEDEKTDIEDENLRKIMCDKIIKKTYANFDMYMFKYDCTERFLFDFCFSLCKIKVVNEQIYITILTDKKGNIIV